MHCCCGGVIWGMQAKVGVAEGQVLRQEPRLPVERRLL